MFFQIADLISWMGARIANAEVWDSARLDSLRIERIAPLAKSRSGEISFFFSKEYQAEVMQARPSVLVTAEPFVKPIQASGLPLWKESVILVCPDPYFAMAVISEKFAARISSVAHLEKSESSPAEIHPSAVVHPTAELAPGVRIGANCVVEEKVKLGAGTVLYPGCFIGPRARLGERCVLFPNVVIYEWCEIGDRVRIHANSVVGADGFGYAPKLQKQGDALLPVDHQKIYHLGKVVIGDDVEIGACSTIDRGTLDDTWIGPKVKIDNQVQIAHNVKLGEGTIVCGETGMAGSASTGRFVLVGGQTGISNRVHLGDFSKIGALTVVTKDVEPGGCVVGIPARDQRDHFRLHAALNRQYLDKKKAERKPPHE